MPDNSHVASSALLFKGGPNLIDLLIDANELRITVTGPRMLFERLQLVTTLSTFEGYTVPRLREFVDHLEGTIHCGLVGNLSAVAWLRYSTIDGESGQVETSKSLIPRRLVGLRSRTYRPTRCFA
jgi:hypothetical protein